MSGTNIVRSFVQKTPPVSRDTGMRKYFTAPVIDRIQLMASTGQVQSDLADLTEFKPRFNLPPYPISDMILVKPPSSLDSSSRVVPDLSFSICDDGLPPFSAPLIFGECSYGAVQGLVHAIGSAVAKDENVLFAVGEGGVHPAIFADQSLMEHVMAQNASGLFGFTGDIVKRVRVISSKYDQIAKKGVGGHLPKRKNKKEIADARGFPVGIDIYSDANLVFSIEEMRSRAAGLWKAVTGGRVVPSIAKSGSSHPIRFTVAGAIRAGYHGMIVEGLGGGTGSSPVIHRDNIGIEVEKAVRIAYLQRQAMGLGPDDFKIIAGGRVDLPSKAFKLNLLGADGWLLGTGYLAAMGCKVVNLCGSDCLAALTAIPELADGSPKKQLDPEWAYSVLRNFTRAFLAELRMFYEAYGLSGPREAAGRTDLLHGVEMSDQLGGALGIEYSPPSRSIVALSSAQPYLQKHRETLATTGKPISSSMGRTTDLDPHFSNLDLLTHEGRSIVGPSYDTYREIVETNLRGRTGGYTISLPIIFDDSENGGLKTEAMARLSCEKNTVLLTGKNFDGDPNRKVVFIDPSNLDSEIFKMRGSSGVQLDAADATSETVHSIKTLSPLTPIFVTIDADENIRERVATLARAGVDCIIISGNLSTNSKVPIDVAISQADDELRQLIDRGKIQRTRVTLLAKTGIRSARDIFALNCLGADFVVIEPSLMISNPNYDRLLTFVSGLAAEHRLLMGAAGLSMMDSVVGNRNVLRANHNMPRETAALLGVDFDA